MATADEQVIVGGQRAVAVSEVAGSYLYDGGATDIQCVVKNGDKAQRAIKVVLVDGGGQPILDKVIKTAETMPQASADMLGTVYMHNGESSASYKHGYIYEGNSVPANTASVIFSPNTISCSGSDFWDFWKSPDGAPDNYTEIVKGEMLFVGGNTWEIVGRNNNDEIIKTYQQYDEDWVALGFSFTGTFEEGDSVGFTCAINESDSTLYWWKRIDVQPAGSGSSTGIAVDDALSLSSQNPVQNKVITKALDEANGIYWQKPSDWVDIRSGALPESIYLLVGHSADYVTYPNFGVYATISDSGTYDVYVDGIKQATTASGTATTLNWQTLALTSGWDVTYPASLRTHIIRITPTSSANAITRLSFTNTISFTQGILWMHSTLSTAIRADYLTYGSSSDTQQCPVLKAVTSSQEKGLKLTSQIGRMFKSCGIEAICPLDFTGETSNISATEAFRSANKLTFLKFNGLDVSFTGDRIFSSCSDLKQIEIDGKGSLRWGWQILSSASALKVLPQMAVSESTANYGSCISNATSLQDTFVDMTGATAATSITMNNCPGIKGLTVSNEAPFTGSSPQINVANDGLDRGALVNLFNSMPTVTGSQVCNITGTTGAADLTAEDLAIATSRGWTVTR